MLESMADYLNVCTFGTHEATAEKNGNDAIGKNDNDVIIVNDDDIEAGNDDATLGKDDNGNGSVGSDDSSDEDVGREGPIGDPIGNANDQAAIIVEESVWWWILSDICFAQVVISYISILKSLVR